MLRDSLKAMRACPQPIVCLVQGAAAGGGLAFALCADILVAGESAAFHPAFIKIGLSGSELAVSWRLQRAIGAEQGVARLSGRKHEALSIAGDAGASGEDVAVMPLDDLFSGGQVSPSGSYVIKLDVEGVEIAALQGATQLLKSDCVVICEEHGNDPNHTVSRYILNETPLTLIVHDPVSSRFETLTELSLLDRIKVASHVGYNVFGTSSAFWQDRFNRLNATASRRVH